MFGEVCEGTEGTRVQPESPKREGKRGEPDSEKSCGESGQEAGKDPRFLFGYLH